MRDEPTANGRGRWADVADTARALVVGEPPKVARARWPRARRVAWHRVRVEVDRLVWPSRTGASGAILLGQIARIALVEVAYPKGAVVLYALVIDTEGAVRVRIAASGSRTARGVVGKRRLREMCEGLRVPVTRENLVLGRPKDYRQQWPEAFSFLRAYPCSTAVAAFVAWMVVVPVLDRVLG